MWHLHKIHIQQTNKGNANCEKGGGREGGGVELETSCQTKF